MTIPERDGWLVDERFNRAQISFFGSREAAEAALKSLYDCSHCTNCMHCVHCSTCWRCDNCSYLSYCSHCLRSSNIFRRVDAVNVKGLE